MSCAVGDSELHHQDLPFNNAMWYLLMSTRTAYSAVITAEQTWAVQPYRVFVAPTKKWGGGAPKGILYINLFPMSMVSMVGSTSWWLQLLCITSFSLSALWSLTSLQKQRGEEGLGAFVTCMMSVSVYMCGYQDDLFITGTHRTSRHNIHNTLMSTWH